MPHRLKEINESSQVMEKRLLGQLFVKWATEDIVSIDPLPLSGSNRKYYRITGETKTVIGTYNPDEKEISSFITFSRHFKRYNLNVPAIYAYDLAKCVYLQEDLGYMTLFRFIESVRSDDTFPEEAVMLYKKVIEQLPKFQVVASTYFDYSLCYPRSSFDKQSMMWDLNYFKYYFLRLADITFDEQKLEDDFNKLADFLLQAENNYFLYRDFQSRNIMLFNNDLFFIDYQSGRKGPLQYDVASLLYDAKADLPQNIRDELLDNYISAIQLYTKINKDNFFKYFYGFVLLRIFQAMGAYGFRGFYERKYHFLTSIPYALKNLSYLRDKKSLKIDLPELQKVVDQIIESEELQKYSWQKTADDNLHVRIFSFSYYDKIPQDLSGNGGGFIFDCRSLNNPGRYDQYKSLNGTDREVKLFFENDPYVKEFLNHTFALIDETVMNYISRGFTDLIISFGCTGGQHRSVYAAEQLAYYLNKKFKILIDLTHTKLNINKKLEPVLPL